MADDDAEPKAPLSPAFSSYEGLGSTVLVTLANLIPSSQGRIIATVVAAPLGAALGRFISWKIQQRKRADVRLIINEEIDTYTKSWPAPTSRPSAAKSSTTSWNACAACASSNYC